MFNLTCVLSILSVKKKKKVRPLLNKSIQRYITNNLPMVGWIDVWCFCLGDSKLLQLQSECYVNLNNLF